MLKTWRFFNHCQRLPLFLFSVLWYWIALLWTTLDLMPKEWLHSCHEMKVNGHNSTISILFLSTTQNIWQNKWFFLSGFSSCIGQVFLFLTLVDRHALVLFVGGNCCFDFQIFHFSLKTFFFFISSCKKQIVFYLFFKINRGNILHELGNNRKRRGIRFLVIKNYFDKIQNDAYTIQELRRWYY